MSAPRPYHHGNLREALIELATAHIAAEGIESLSIRSLARAAGVAHRAAYQHFSDREGLIAATLTAAYERLETRIARAASGVDGIEEKLAAAAKAYAAFAFDEPQMFLAMSGPRINEGGAYRDLEAALGRAWRHIAVPIRDATESGRFTLADGRAAAAIFWGGLSGVLTQCALGRIKLKASERRAFFEVVIERLIAALKA